MGSFLLGCALLAFYIMIGYFLINLVITATILIVAGIASAIKWFWDAIHDQA